MLPEIPPLSTEAQTVNYTFVAIVDGVVATTFKVQDRAASVLNSNPTFVQIPDNVVIPIGSVWDGQNFIVNTEN